MGDLIRREDAIKILSERAEILQGEYGDLGGACSGALKIIKSLPSAEPEWVKGKCTKINCLIQMNYISNDCDIKTCPYRTEQKKGEWIDEKINSYTSRTYCSECGSSAPFVYASDDYYGNHAHGETAKTKFCPNCGADMRLQNT